MARVEEVLAPGQVSRIRGVSEGTAIGQTTSVEATADGAWSGYSATLSFDAPREVEIRLTGMRTNSEQREAKLLRISTTHKEPSHDTSHPPSRQPELPV
jgi:hypothetical protein